MGFFDNLREPNPGEPGFRFDFISEKGRERIPYEVGYNSKCLDEKEYDLNSKLHCTTGPALQNDSCGSYTPGYQSGWTTEWYMHGELHRNGGPAYEQSNGNYEYYQNGKLHRDDGPARVNVDEEVTEYYQNGELHRNYGPARTGTYIKDEWYNHGVRITKHNNFWAAIYGVKT